MKSRDPGPAPPPTQAHQHRHTDTHTQVFTRRELRYIIVFFISASATSPPEIKSRELAPRKGSAPEFTVCGSTPPYESGGNAGRLNEANPYSGRGVFKQRCFRVPPGLSMACVRVNGRSSAVDHAASWSLACGRSVRCSTRILGHLIQQQQRRRCLREHPQRIRWHSYHVCDCFYVLESTSSGYTHERFRQPNSSSAGLHLRQILTYE